MFVRVLISVDRPYAPVPISGIGSVLISQAPGLAGCCHQQPSGGREHNPRKLRQAESSRMQA
jgi:hypothetical protein